MTGSAAIKRIGPKPPFEGHYRWDEPDSNLTLYLQPEMVDRLQIDALAGAPSRSDAGKEVGGVLLGRVLREEGRILIVVDEFEPVRCEYANGPFYALHTEDASVFAAALAWGGTRRVRSVVGYYRSHNRNGLFLSADDLQLIQRHFRGPENVFLLIKPLPNGACTAGFFFWKDSRIQSEFTDSEVPLIPISVSFPAEKGVTAEPAANHAPQPAAAPEHRPGTTAAALACRRDLSPRLLGALVVTGIALATTFAVIANRAARPLPKRHAPAVPVAAARAIPAPLLPARQPALTPVEQSKTELRPAGGERIAPLRSEPRRPASLPVAKATAAPPLPQIPPPPTDLALNAAPQLPAAAPIVPPVPVMPPPFAEKAPAPPAAPSKVTRTLVGPQVIHQVTPAVPRGVGPKITTDVQVDVEVTVDANGKVTAARIVSTRGAAAELLTIEGLKAAQLFRFRPAQENGRAVPGSAVLTFRFAPTAK